MQIFAPFLIRRNNIVVRIIALLVPLVLLLLPLTQTVFAENTYVITDGEDVTVYTTFAKDPAEVLDLAGVELADGDLFTTQSGDGVSNITIQRSQKIVVNYRGQSIETTSFGETVASVLDRLGIEADSEYVVSLPTDAQTFNGMQIDVDHVVSNEQKYTVDIAYETIYCEDPSLPKGHEREVVAGVAGQKQYKAQVVYTNGEQTETTVLEETVLQEPVDRVVAVGTGTAVGTKAPAIGNGVIITADGQVLAYKRADKFKTTAYNHTDAGCDMITATGTTVRVGTVAVDPTVIPYGTRMFIVSNDGEYVYGIATAEDCGGGIKGKHIDLYFPDVNDCWKYGVRSATVYFLD